MLSFYRIPLLFLLCLFSVACQPPAKVQKVETFEYKISPKDYAMVDSVMIRKIQPFKDSLDADMNVVLVKSVVVMDKGQPESKLGNFVSDVCLYICLLYTS